MIRSWIHLSRREMAVGLLVALSKPTLFCSVIARGPARPNTHRKMGHDRFPPAGYVECFRPNVRLRYQKARIVPRHPPLTAEDIRACETRDW